MDKPKNPVYCPWMWHGISDRDGESLYPCCRFDYFNDPGVPAHGVLTEQINSELFLRWRSEMRQGNKVSSCFKCHQDEAAGLESERIVAIKEEGSVVPTNDQIDLSQIHTAEAFIGNQCNLRCHTCNPTSSSGWKSEYEKLGWLWPSSESRTVIADNIRSFINLRSLKIIGGEPAYSKKFDELIESIVHPEKIEIQISTNATRPIKNGTLERLKKFKRVTLSLSIDGYKDLNELIRYPSKWTEVESTVNRYFEDSQARSFYFSLHTTVSLLNIFELLPLLDWWRELAKPPTAKVHLSILRSPSFLSIQNLDKSQRKKLLALFERNSESSLEKIKSELKITPSQSGDSKELLSYCQQIDIARQTHLVERLQQHHEFMRL